MSFLNLYRADQPQSPELSLSDGEKIQAFLADQGVRFERWQASKPLNDNATQSDILSAYADEVSRLKEENGFQTADVISLTPAHPDKVALREKFLSEHIHSEDEVRFFVRGRGLFYMHLEDKVVIVGCCKQDLISVPAGTRHWFDMGSDPDFTCIRLFTNPEGWVAQYSGDTLADDFPRFEALAGQFS